MHNIYKMMCVNIWIKHGHITLPILYKTTYNFVGVLLRHVYDDLYCMWSNAILRYIVTIVWPTGKNLKTNTSILKLLFNTISILSLWLRSFIVRFSSNLWNYLFVSASSALTSYMTGNAIPFCSWIMVDIFSDMDMVLSNNNI